MARPASSSQSQPLDRANEALVALVRLLARQAAAETLGGAAEGAEEPAASPGETRE